MILFEFTADSDAILTKGIVALLLRVFSNQTPEAILQAKTEFIDEIGLKGTFKPNTCKRLSIYGKTNKNVCNCTAK